MNKLTSLAGAKSALQRFVRFSPWPAKGSSGPADSYAKLKMEALEPLNMLAAVYPDMFAWADQSRGYLYDYVVEGDLLRFSTALANMGDGHLELRGGQVLSNGNQEVWQRIYHDDGTWEDHLAGEFTYHPGHGHIHFDGYAAYNLREITTGGGVGDIVATGGKVSFCLIDISQYDPNAGSSNYHSCGQIQGVSAGWSDVYSRSLPDQWINIAGVADGQYWLEIVIDPDSQLIESDETNNSTRIVVDIVDGPGDNGDHYEPNNDFVQASNLGLVAHRHEAAISVHTETDVDYFQFTAVEDGDFEVTVEFTHALGNLDAYIYDASQNLIASGNSTDDLEIMEWFAIGGETYYLQVEGEGTDTNAYELDFHGPGDIVTETVSSTNVPVNIPDGVAANSPGPAAVSTLQGPDITLSDLNLIFDDLDHTWLGDLHFELTSPSGTTAVVITSQWESGGGLLGSEDNFTNTFLDDQAPTNLGDGTAPFSGSYNVEHSNVATHPLSLFNGESALGTWTIEITDWFSADTGALNAWSMMFTGLDNNPGDEYEQNDAFPQATYLGELGAANVENLSIHVPTDEDFFRFKALATGIAQVDLSFINSNGNLDFFIYDDSLTEIARGDSTSDNETASFVVQTEGLYYIQVVGYTGDTNDYSLAVGAPTSVMEFGEISSVGTTWQTINFDRAFAEPVVMLALPSVNDKHPLTTRIRNVTSTGFELQVKEWDYQDGVHAIEQIGYLVIEAGRHENADGTIIEAGKVNDVGQESKGFFEQQHNGLPVLLTQIESDLSQAMVPQVIHYSPRSFGLRVQQQEASQPGPVADVHWMAILPGSGDLAGRGFEAGIIEQATDKSVQHGFQTAFNSTPMVFASLLSSRERDPVTIRSDRISREDFQYFLQEEQSADLETSHRPERMGYFAIDSVMSFLRPSAAPQNSITITENVDSIRRGLAFKHEGLDFSAVNLQRPDFDLDVRIDFVSDTAPIRELATNIIKVNDSVFSGRELEPIQFYEVYDAYANQGRSLSLVHHKAGESVLIQEESTAGNVLDEVFSGFSF